MRTVSLHYPDTVQYNNACTFAQELYWKKTRVELMNLPERLFVIEENNRIYGCMGLNMEKISFTLVRDDHRFKNRCAQDSKIYGEQCVFAVGGFKLAVPVLISTVAAYASYLGIDWVAYTSIPPSQKVIDRLGYLTEDLGPVDLSILSTKDKLNCDHWFSAHQPRLHILNTALGKTICHEVFERFSHRILLSKSLQNKLG